MSTFQPGDTVAVSVAGGGEAIVRVWRVTNTGIVLVSDDENFRLLAEGLPALWPVAFHPEDVRAVRSA